MTHERFFFRTVQKQTPWNASLYFFSLEKLALLSLLEEIKRCPDRIVIKPLLTFDNLFPPYRHLAKTPTKMTTAIAFSRQNMDFKIQRRDGNENVA